MVSSLTFTFSYAVGTGAVDGGKSVTESIKLTVNGAL